MEKGRGRREERGEESRVISQTDMVVACTVPNHITNQNIMSTTTLSLIPRPLNQRPGNEAYLTQPHSQTPQGEPGNGAAKLVTHNKTYCFANFHNKHSSLDHLLVKSIDCLLGTPRVHVLLDNETEG